jgi:prolyl oligopeptidase
MPTIKSPVPRLLAPALLLALALAAAPPARALLPSPPTRVEIVRDTLHGVVIEDPYRWLEAKDAPETRAWIDLQNRYRESVMAELPGLDAIRARLAQLLQVDAMGMPIEHGGRYFFTRRRADQDLNLLCMRRGPDGKDEVLSDPHALTADRSKSVLFMDISLDGKLVAIGTRDGGADEVTVAFRDVDSGRDLPDRLPSMLFYSLAITPDRKGVYYSKFTPEGPRVFHHTLGTEAAEDRAVFGEGYGPDKYVDAELSEEGRYLVVTVQFGSSGERSEVWVKDLAADGPLTAVIKDLPGFFSGSVVGDQLYVQTNWKAPKSRILRVDLKDPAPERWTEVVPEGAGVLESFSLAGGRLFVNYLENVASKVRIFTAQGKPLGEIAFPTIGTVGGMIGRWASNEAFFTFSSFVVPTTIFRYDVTTGKRTVFWRSSSPVASDTFETRQVWYASKDGTKVPMFLVHRKGLRLEGHNPVYLTGYGGFTVNETPRYSSTAVMWAEAGGVFALPSLRGGAEFGEDWHRAGMLEKKQNVFDDFIAAAEWLVQNQYTTPERIAIEGGSNGGLLVGAALTQRPDLFRAVVCEYPLLDMLRYQDFLLARLWVPEYGSAEDPKQFPYLRAYSPYEQLKPGTAYPATLFVTGDSDTRVDPLHARKMTARLQAATGSERPVLLHYDVKAGHSGGTPISKRIEDSAVVMQFLYWQLGMTPPAAPADAAPAKAVK